MVRFNDKPLITTLSDDDIMPITDMSDPSSDKKMNMKQLSEYVANLASHDVASAFKTLGTETVSSDSSAYKEILDRKHSTFDRSKFTVVGSPTITDYGIASGFSSSNYLLQEQDITPTKSLDINFTITPSSDVVSGQYFIGTLNSNNIPTLCFQIQNNGFQVPFGASSLTDISGWGILGTCTPNVKNYLRITWNGTEYKVLHSLDKNNWNTLRTIQSTSILSFNKIALGRRVNISSDNFTGSIDLKQFSITVDGVEVFNGNKTGIDQIKKDDYEVVGSPIISDDGVLNDCNASSKYLNKSIDLDTSKNIKVCFSFIVGDEENPTLLAFYTTENKRWLFQTYHTRTNRPFEVYIQSHSGTTSTLSSNSISELIKTGDLVEVECEFLETTYNFSLTINGNQTVTSGTYTKDTDYNINQIRIGGGLQFPVISSKFDLNAFKIYVDGNLVYQPTLRIPYTQSKTGSKIVNATYRDRVFDLYEQTGKALYYTIDEENKNFTAPLSDIYGMITDNASLNNFTPEGKERFEAQNSYLTGDVLKEEQGLSQVRMMKTSTFDRSKFEVVGTPTITENGVASGFVFDSNYSLDIQTFNTSTSSNWKIIGEFEYDERNADYSAILATQTGYSLFLCYLQNGFQLNLSSNNSSWDMARQFVNKPSGTIRGDKLRVEINYNNNTYTISILNFRTNTMQKETVASSEKIQFLPNRIGNVRGNGNYGMAYGSIDLKQLSIILDGVEVFNGNKTGLDVIKPDNYTKVGTPTITNDGIASGFSSSNYFTKDITISNNYSTFEIDAKIKFNDLNTVYIIGAENNYFLIGQQSNRLILYLSSNGTSWDISSGSFGSRNLVINQDYYIKMLFNGAKYTIKLSTDSLNYTDDIVINSTTKMLFPNHLRIGATWNKFFNGSIDLNAFKIYVDGNLVYQPCLKIPYTQSKTGSKIANIGSRDRVQDIYEQYGYASYYTLEDDSFTLPKGEVYGLIGARSLKSHFRSGINYYDLYSDRELEQGGACTANVAVNLLKPYEDGNYVLSVPYSAKTATSFTPTSTGTWMAKGTAKSLD